MKSLRPRLLSLMLGCALGLIIGCEDSKPPVEPPAPKLASELSVCGWDGYLPQSVQDAFKAEYGVTVNFTSYKMAETAEEELRAGKVYDVVIIGNDFIQRLVGDGLLAELDHRNIPNFKNVSPNFRDLAFDPGNKYTVLYQWGPTILLYRTDMVKEPITGWNDLWDPRSSRKVGIWALQRDLLGIALKSLGYSANTANPHELDAALSRLNELKPKSVLLDLELPHAASYLEKGDALLIHGWGLDCRESRKLGLPVACIIPVEGTFLWSDNLVIPANSPNALTAEVFINFLLRPDVSSKIVSECNTATPLDTSLLNVSREILNDPAIYPPRDVLKKAELTLPLNHEGKCLWNNIWEKFLPQEK